MIFRIVGELIVIFVLAGTGFHQLNKKWLKPLRHHKHMEQLLRENATP